MDGSECWKSLSAPFTLANIFFWGFFFSRRVYVRGPLIVGKLYNLSPGWPITRVRIVVFFLCMPTADAKAAFLSVEGSNVVKLVS